MEFGHLEGGPTTWSLGHSENIVINHVHLLTGMILQERDQLFCCAVYSVGGDCFASCVNHTRADLEWHNVLQSGRFCQMVTSHRGFASLLVATRAEAELRLSDLAQPIRYGTILFSWQVGLASYLPIQNLRPVQKTEVDPEILALATKNKLTRVQGYNEIRALSHWRRTAARLNTSSPRKGRRHWRNCANWWSVTWGTRQMRVLESCSGGCSKYILTDMIYLSIIHVFGTSPVQLFSGRMIHPYQSLSLTWSKLEVNDCNESGYISLLIRYRVPRQT